MVHHVTGRHPNSHYLDNTNSTVRDEINLAFNLEANVYFIAVDNSINRIGLGNGRRVAGVGGRQRKNGGFVLVSGKFDFALAAHELGHAFGLEHDFHNDAYIMSYGWETINTDGQLSTCHAEYLSVHPYFNLNTSIEEGEPPTIELISSPLYPAGAQSIPVRFKVNDSDGLHQLILFVTTIEPHSAAGFLEVKACWGLEGDRDTVVPFNYDGVIPSDGLMNLSHSVIHPISVEAVNKNGDVGYASFGLVEISPHHIATLAGHTDQVGSVSFSSDGNTLATGSWDGTVKLWDVMTQQDIATLRSEGDRLSFSSDGETLATGSWDGTVKLWDVTTQQEIDTLPGHTDQVDSVSFSRDGSTLATGARDGTVKLWDVAARQEIDTLTGHTDQVDSVSFSSDGSTLATGSWDGTVKLWDVATHRNIGTLPHGTGVNSVVFSPVDATLLATGARDGTVKLWDVTTQQDIGTLPGHTNQVNSVLFSRDGGTLISGSWDRTVKLWDMTTRTNFATLPHRDRLHSVAFSSDGRTLASGTIAGTVELWDMSWLMGARLELTTEINILDPNLRAAIVAASELPPNTPILRGHLQALTDLDVFGTSISNLTGLEGATNLRKLYLWDHSISDISAVSGLTLLTTVHLSQNSISNISAVAGLTNLKHLSLSNNNVSDISSVSGLTQLNLLHLHGNSISDISAVAGLTNLTDLNLNINNVSDISAVSGLTNLRKLHLWNNSISDISALVANTGLGTGDTVVVQRNPLSYQSIHTHIPILEKRGVEIYFDNIAQPALLKISGDNQTGASFVPLPQPFVVEAQDENGSMLAGISVTFTVVAGGGTLSVMNTRTDPNGRAQSTLILGPNLGTNTVQVSAAGIEVPATFHAVSDMEAPPTIADVNNDGSVNVLDLIVIASSLGQSGYNSADVNGDRVVTVLDLILAAGMFEGAAAAPAAHPQVPETLTAVEVQGWLTDAKSLEDKDPVMKRGIVVLEQLLVSLTPTETELLANYPNPFNPETWIPYRLAKDAFVTLTIYDPSGHVVRTLEVGHRIASAYENRSKAIYWDGKNGLGESVASGVYFYTLSAGRYGLSVPHRSDYSATRKMVILK